MHTKLPTVLTINSEEDWSTLTKQPHGQLRKTVFTVVLHLKP